MDHYKYENSLDNRRAALVSREARAPRAAGQCKSCSIMALKWTDSGQRARGAQVSRAARESNGVEVPQRSLAATACGARHSLRGVARATPSNTDA